MIVKREAEKPTNTGTCESLKNQPLIKNTKEMGTRSAYPHRAKGQNQLVQ